MPPGARARRSKRKANRGDMSSKNDLDAGKASKKRGIDFYHPKCCTAGAPGARAQPSVAAQQQQPCLLSRFHVGEVLGSPHVAQTINSGSGPKWMAGASASNPSNTATATRVVHVFAPSLARWSLGERSDPPRPSPALRPPDQSSTGSAFALGKPHCITVTAVTMLSSSSAFRTFARRVASSNSARRFASSGASAGGAASAAETQSAQQTAAYITAGAFVVSMACVSQAGQKVRDTMADIIYMCVLGYMQIHAHHAHALELRAWAPGRLGACLRGVLECWILLSRAIVFSALTPTKLSDPSLRIHAIT
jgi:hypothetical protein